MLFALVIAGLLTTAVAATADVSLSDLYHRYQKMMADKDTDEDRSNDWLAINVDATATRIAFSLPLHDGSTLVNRIGIALYDIPKGSWQFLKPATSGGGYFNPKFSSSDPDYLFLTERFAYDLGTSVLKRCRISPFTCDEILRVKGLITDPIEMKEGILVDYSRDSSQPGEHPSFNSHDLYLVDGKKNMERVTFLDFYGLFSLSLLSNRIIFSAIGLSDVAKEKYKIDEPQYQVGQTSSNIYSLPFDVSIRALTVNKSTFQPYAKIEFSVSGGPSTTPSSRIGSSLLAFKNGRSEKYKGYRYNLVVRDMNTGEQDYVISQTFGMSSPTVVSADTVLYYEHYHGFYTVKAHSFSTKETKTIAALDWNSSTPDLEKGVKQ